MKTVSPELDAAAAFAHERRRQSLARLGVKLRIVRDDVSVMLPLEEVLDALGRAGARSRHAASASCTSSKTVITACRSPARGSASRRAGATTSCPRTSSRGRFAPAGPRAGCSRTPKRPSRGPRGVRPIADLLGELGVGGPGTETTRYLRSVKLRNLLMQERTWSEDVIEKLLDATRTCGRDEVDEVVHRILKEMR